MTYPQPTPLAPFPNPQGYQTVEDAYLRNMPVLVRLYKRASVDGYNQETYSNTYEEIPCQLEGSDEDFTGANWNQIHSTGVAYFGWVIPWLTVNDRMDVPDTAETSGWRRVAIGGIAEKYGPTGIHHQEVFYGPIGAAGVGVGSG